MQLADHKLTVLLPNAHRVCVDPVSMERSLEVVERKGDIFVMDEGQKRLPEPFFSRPSGDRFEGGVERQKFPFWGECVEDVVRSINERTVSRLAFLQRDLGQLSFGDQMIDRQQSCDLPFLIAHDGLRLYVSLFDLPCFAIQSNALLVDFGDTRFEYSPFILAVLLREIRTNEICIGLADQLLMGPCAERFHGSLVRQDIPTLSVLEHDLIRDGVNNRAKQSSFPLQSLLQLPATGDVSRREDDAIDPGFSQPVDADRF